MTWWFEFSFKYLRKNSWEDFKIKTGQMLVISEVKWQEAPLYYDVLFGYLKMPIIKNKTQYSTVSDQKNQWWPSCKKHRLKGFQKGNNAQQTSTQEIYHCWEVSRRHGPCPTQRLPLLLQKWPEEQRTRTGGGTGGEKADLEGGHALTRTKKSSSSYPQELRI